MPHTNPAALVISPWVRDPHDPETDSVGLLVELRVLSGSEYCVTTHDCLVPLLPTTHTKKNKKHATWVTGRLLVNTVVATGHHHQQTHDIYIVTFMVTRYKLDYEESYRISSGSSAGLLNPSAGVPLYYKIAKSLRDTFPTHTDLAFKRPNRILYICYVNTDAKALRASESLLPTIRDFCLQTLRCPWPVSTPVRI